MLFEVHVGVCLISPLAEGGPCLCHLGQLASTTIRYALRIESLEVEADGAERLELGSEIKRVLTICLQIIKGLGVETHQQLVDGLISKRFFAEMGEVYGQKDGYQQDQQRQVLDEVGDLVEESTGGPIL